MLKALISFLGKRKNTQDPCSKVLIDFDENEVWVHWPDRPIQSIPWNNLLGVAIDTNDDGPFDEDLFWHLASKEVVLTFPSAAVGCEKILVKLQELDGFDNGKLIDAMSCCEKKTFILWDHKGRHKNGLS